MTEQEIIAGNKLIAYSKYSDEDIRTWIEDIPNPSNKFALKTINYHNQIIMLMGVLENIERSGCIVEISMCLGRTCTIHRVSNGVKVSIGDMDLNTACYKAILEFLNSEI